MFKMVDIIVPTPTPLPPIPFQNQVYNFLVQNIYLFFFLISGIIMIVIFYKIAKFLYDKRHKKQLLFKDFKVGKYNIIFYRKIGGSYVEIEKKKMDIKREKFRFNNKDFNHFDKNKIAYSTLKANYYAFDFDSGTQLSYGEKGLPDKITTEEIDIYVNRNIISQLVKGLEELKSGKGQWLMLIVGLALGIAIGIIIGMYTAPALAPKVIQTPIPTGVL